MKELKLKLSEVVIDHAAQPRAGSLDQDHVEELADAYRAKKKIDPPTVWKVGNEYRLAQGFHRVEAARRAGLTSLTFVIEEGTDSDWRIDAACSNQGHGLKRTNKDKRRCLTILFRLLPNKSNSLIAEMAGVSVEYVRQQRPEPSNASLSPVATVATGDKPSSEQKRTGKDGVEQSATKTKPAEKQAQTPPAATNPAPESDALDAPFDNEPEATPQLVKLPDADPTPAEQPSTGGDDATAVAEDTPTAGVEAEEAPMPAEVADPAAEYVSRLNRLCVAIDRLKADVLGLSDSPFGRLAHTESVTAQLVAARQSLWLSRPTDPCPVAAEHAEGVNCRVCLNTGYTSEAAAKRAEKSKGRGL